MPLDLVENIRHHGFKRLLLAVSGGLDSICLANYFIENREALGIEWLGIAHVHHGLREGTADRDAAFVEAFAKSHGVPFFLKKLDGNALKAADGSLEENARDARYKALVEIANIKAQSEATSKCHRHDLTPHTCIVTAHHAGDQAETMFMRIKRGTTLAGLRGIQEVRAMICEQSENSFIDPIASLQDDKSSGSFEATPLWMTMQKNNAKGDPGTMSGTTNAYENVSGFFGENRLRTKNSQPQREQSDRPHTSYLIFRPFLNVTRAELLEYAREHDLSWCEDESNTDVKFARNSIRHQLLPHLEKEVPGATKQLCRIAELADKAYEKVTRKCDILFATCLNKRMDSLPSVENDALQDDNAHSSYLKESEATDPTPHTTISLDKKKLNKILVVHKEADLSEMFRLWLSEKGFRFPIGFFYSNKEPAHIKIPTHCVYRKRSIVKIRHTVWFCEFKDALSAAKFVSCEMKEKDYNEST